jgi:hypothetical protein
MGQTVRHREIPRRLAIIDDGRPAEGAVTGMAP